MQQSCLKKVILAPKKFLLKCSKANKSFLNVHKSKYKIFDKPGDNDNLPLRLLLLSIIDHNTRRSLLGVVVDQYFS